MLLVKNLVIFFLLHIHQCCGLDFNSALESGIFKPIRAGAISENITIHPKREPSISMYYASEGFPPREDFSITFQLDESWISDIGDDFTVGVSIVFLQFLSDNSIIDVTIEHDREPVVKETVHPNIYLPPDKNETHFKTSSILRSFSQRTAPSRRGKDLKLILRFKDWSLENTLYFTVTSYKIGLWDNDIGHCDGYSFHPHWWNCNTNVENSPLICINYDLTCDGLPHCAELQIPNPDEDCDYHVGMQEALQLIVYCLMTVFLVLLTAGCAKCCLRGCCPNRFRSWRGQNRRSSDMIDIITAESNSRPDGSPPTYDDAMKYVNDAFEDSDTETAEPPPTYSPTLKEGEEVCTLSHTHTTSTHNNQDNSHIHVTSHSDLDRNQLPTYPPPYTQ